MEILGISGLYHDSAAALIRDGEIVAAASEERFTRIKADASLPVHAIRYCMRRMKENELTAVVYYDNPVLTLDRWLSNIVLESPNNQKLIDRSFDGMFINKLWVHEKIEEAVGNLGKYEKLICCEHHVSHAASAFYPSPFAHAAILTLDGVGEWATATIGRGNDTKIEILRQLNYPDSLGLLYSAFTYFCGFKVNFGEYKLMGLAPYGEPIYENLIREKLIDIRADGSFRLNQEYFTYTYDDTMIGESFERLFGISRRIPEDRITKQYMDIAASIQKITEDIILKLARTAREITGETNLVMAGGTALNCVANGKLQLENIFKNIWIQPAAGDAGGAIGCALYAYYNKFNRLRTVKTEDSQKGSYLGPAYSNDDIQSYLDEKKLPYHKLGDDELFIEIAKQLANDKIIGCLQGHMEFGPRALGGRSILANPMSEKMQSKLNLKIKFRESFRPFAPAVLEECAGEYFDAPCDSPYMLKVFPVKQSIRTGKSYKELLHESDSFDIDMLDIINRKRSDIPAVTHVDYSARVQTVNEERNPYFYKVIKEFWRQTGCGVVVNTSFNVRGEPIVCTPQDAYRCFMRTEMDVLVMESFILYKEEQPKLESDVDWRSVYELD